MIYGRELVTTRTTGHAKVQSGCNLQWDLLSHSMSELEIKAEYIAPVGASTIPLYRVFFLEVGECQPI